jgi:hypothetical protein
LEEKQGRLEEDIVVGVVYIPPENTSYSSPGSFIQIENEYLDISRNYYYVALLGDFNESTDTFTSNYLLICHHQADYSR